jgi:hypothetical protein
MRPSLSLRPSPSQNQSQPSACDALRTFSGHDLAERLYTSHLNKSGRVLAEQALAEKLAGSPDPESLAARIERTHTAWLPVWEEWKRRGISAPRLDRWIREDRYLDDPPDSHDPDAADDYRPASEYLAAEEVHRG